MITFGLIHYVTASAAFISLACSLICWAFGLIARHRNHEHIEAEGRAIHVVRGLSLQLGVIAAILLCVILMMRTMYVMVDVIRGYPWSGRPAYGFGAGGLWSLGALLVSAVLGLMQSRDARLITCALWLCVAIGMWGSLLLPVYRVTATGGIHQSGVSAYLMASLSIALAIFVLVQRRLRRMRHPRLTHCVGPEGHHWIPGLRTSFVGLGCCIAGLVWYHLLVPLRGWRVGLRADLVMAVGSALLASKSCFLLWGRGAGGNLGDTATTLGSLAIAGTVMAGCRLNSGPMNAQYPGMFAAAIVGFAVGCVVWTIVYFRIVDRARLGVVSDGAGNAGHFRRAALLSAALGLIASTVLAFWPRLPGISALDHSFWRIGAGLGANVVLLLVLLWASRVLKMLTFQILSLLSVGAIVCFLLVRALPFRSHLG